MKTIKIIGLPVPVSERGHRIVLDENVRRQYGIAADDTVLMENTEDGQIRLFPSRGKKAENLIRKSISAGRFNLPKEWSKENNVGIGSFIHLILTAEGILICPGSFNFPTAPGGTAWN